jgi:serine/threonine-protein kinase
MHKHLKAQLVPPDHVNPKISAGCAQVIEMMMAKKQSDRYRKVEDVLEDLRLVQQGEPPHFARRQIDLTGVTLTSDSGLPAAPKARGNDFASSAMYRLILVIMIISIIANVVLAATILLK